MSDKPSWLCLSRFTRLVMISLLTLFYASACTTGLTISDPEPPVDNPPESPVWPAPEIPSNLEAPVTQILSPVDGSELDEDTIVVEGTASDDSGLATVFVQVGSNTPILAQTRDGFRTWELASLLPFGTTEIRAWAFDTDGRRSADAVIEVTRSGAPSDALAPTVEILAPEDGSTPLHNLIVLTGITADDRGIERMELSLQGQVLHDRPFETQDHFATWARLVTLRPGEENVLSVRAYDASNNVGTAQLRLYARAQDDRLPPVVTVTSPTDGGTVATAHLQMTGTAHDNIAVREVKVRSAEAIQGSCTDVLWRPYVGTQTSDGYAHWSAELPLSRGDVCIEARAIDVSGLSSSVYLRLDNQFVPQWSPETSYLMRLHRLTEKPKVRLELSRAGLGQVMSSQIQHDLVIAELDLEPLLFNALTSIKEACGTCWKGNANCATDHYDCSLTSLGCSFGEGASCSGWRDSPEYALVRLLTLTPDNADVRGSSLGAMAEVVDAINSFSFGLVQGFPELLATALDISRHREVVTTDGVVQALTSNLIATHSAFNHANGQYLLPVTMHDALHDLAPLREKLGPLSNGHPGVVDPSFPVHGVIFPHENFRMVLIAESNLRWHDGLSLGIGKNYLSSVSDDGGVGSQDIVDFDFYDPDRFQIIGLPPMPTVDLRFSLTESPRNIPVCGGDGCKDHLPSNPRPNYVWALEPWLLESILARSAYNTYTDPALQAYARYAIIFTLAEIFVGHAGNRTSNPMGWMQMNVGGIAQILTGSPPPPQFMWEAIMDIAEVVAHRNVKTNLPTPPCPNHGGGENEYTICEGDLNPRFTLYDIPTGVTAQTLSEASRDQLHAQREILTQRLLGGFEENNGCVDFYYVERDGQRMFWETHPNDPLPSDCIIGPSNGFFADEALTQKVSSVSIAGVAESPHEKWLLQPGEHTLFTRGNDQRVYRITAHVPAQPSINDEITVRVAHKL